MKTVETTNTKKFIESIQRLLKKKNHNKSDENNLKILIQQLYKLIHQDEIEAYSNDDFLAIAESLYEFISNRKDYEIKVRVYNPEEKLHGWQSSNTVVELLNDDKPFLVDSVTEEILRHNYSITQLIHPIISVKRSPKGYLKEISSSSEQPETKLESLMQFQISRINSKKERDNLEKEITKVLELVSVAVSDWKEIVNNVTGIISELEFSGNSLKGRYTPSDLQILRKETNEALDFIRWLVNNNFVFLGYRRYDSNKGNHTLVKGSSLGVLSKIGQGLEPEELEERKIHRIKADKNDTGILTITKANKKSVIHRPVHMDYIVVRSFDTQGNITGEHRIIGMFTSTVYYQSAKSIPIVKNKIASIQERSGFDSQGHSGKALMAVLEDFPRDELLQASEDSLFHAAMSITTCSLQPKVRLFLRLDDYERFISAIILIPKEKMSTSLRKNMENILCSSFNGTISNHYTQISESHLARVQIIIKTTPGKVPNFKQSDVEEMLADAALSWVDRFESEMVSRFGEIEGAKFSEEYKDAFSPSYQNRFSATDAYFDILQIEKINKFKGTTFDLYNPENDDEGVFSFKIYNPKDKISLSQMMPLLENMGLEVIDEHTYLVSPKTSAEPAWIHRFRIIITGIKNPDLKLIKDNFEDSIRKTWKGEVQNDSLNKLILLAGIPWRKVVLIRAYGKYLQQAGFRYSQNYIMEALSNHPIIVKEIIELFKLRFKHNLSSENKEEKEKKKKKVRKRIETLLSKVSNLAEDIVIRAYLELVNSTLRTNFFQNDKNGKQKSYISFKFRSSEISFLPKPRPFAEIFVYSSKVEGIHLRGGKVARGGLRWSDRREDFRTEVLGLMKAQMTKNSVIIPVGSKGGFVVKQPPVDGGREAFLQEGIECYKTFLRGLLDVTDNRVGNSIVSPKEVVCYDDYDPYLVVAADKGTATFSDIANDISEEYGFWLGDAFASGGSVGYDHKKMGITAKGAWVSVKRHFSEMGINVDKDDFTTVGIGDMSGDVFGNGMLLSKHIRLVAAFNHMHIFLDPNPDAAKSFKERSRLFKLPRSSWKDYDNNLISKGGGVFDRSAKSIKLSPEIRELLDVEETSLTPDELIQKIITARVDLLWNGGIGTYVKAKSESHEDAGDKMNDSVRVNGEDLRAQVVGEGGNLGFTQIGRIEYALKGGRINTDSIDNSAGVDCSDHEVNIKIALGEAVKQNKLSLPQRNILLESMTDEVENLVLRDNMLQTQALTIAQMQGPNQLESQSRLLEKLEQDGSLDRAVEFLPDEDEIKKRSAAGIGLTRPELSVILSYSKLKLFDELSETNLPDDPYYEEDLLSYFPVQLQKKYKKEILEHPLRREIIATSVTNSIVNRIGSTMFYHLQEDNGASACDIARTYTVTRDIFNLRKIWDDIGSLEKNVSVDVKLELYKSVQGLIERIILWFLRHYPQPVSLQKAIDEFSGDATVLSKNWNSILSKDLFKDIYKSKVDHYLESGVPEKLAKEVSGLAPLAAACDIIQVSHMAKLDVRVVAKVYFSLGEKLSISWLRKSLSKISATSYWQRMSLKTLSADIFDQQAMISSEVIKVLCNDSQCSDAVETWFEGNKQKVDRYLQFMEDLKKQEDISESMIVIALQKLKELCS